MDDGYYTVREVCARFNVSRETVRRWERDYWFPKRVRFSRHARGRCGFSIAEVNEWDAARRSARAVCPTAAF